MRSDSTRTGAVASRGMIVAFANLKGGVSKTTSSIYTACGLAEHGSVLLIDADPQGSATLWIETAERLPFTSVAIPTTKVARQTLDLADRFDYIVIDTPPGHPGITSAALAVADAVVVPITTGSVDLVRFSATCELIDTAQAINPDLYAVALLTKTRAGTNSRTEVRAALTEVGMIPVADVEIPLREAIAGAEGTKPSDLSAYPDLIDHLLSVTARTARTTKRSTTR